MKKRWFPLLLLLAAPAISRAEEVALPFSSVWGAVRATSPAQKAAALGLEAAQAGSERSGRHWLPRLFLDARSYSTNDPAQTFMALLGQREASAADFAPATLNHPGASFFTQGTLGLDLPLFEGGARVAEHEARKREVESKSYSLQDGTGTEYLESARLYGTLLILEEESRQLSELARTVDSTLQSYRLGAKGNPVGYSGMLGLRGLKNRVQSQLLQNKESASGLHESLSAMAGSLPDRWAPVRQDFLSFVQDTLPRAAGNPGEPSFAVLSARSSAESLEAASKGEKAKLLPQVGLFAQENLLNGARGTGTSYLAGAYLRWNIFAPTDYGSAREASLRAAQAAENAEASAENARIEQARFRHSAVAAEGAIRQLGENVQLLAEQTEASRKLYRAGAINALQFVEVLSRRADLLAALTQARMELLAARAAELKASRFEVTHE